MSKERMEELRDYYISGKIQAEDLIGEVMKLEQHNKLLIQQNKRYRDFIKTISNPWEIARKIGKETDKNIIRADEVVGWIERETEKILREE